jgi:dTDP-glucose pyrophosphorylase
MIVIPMMGKSSRFFKAGFTIPKYMLPIGSGTVFDHSVRTFIKNFEDQHFVFVVRSDHNAREFVARRASSLGIRDFRIKELCQDTRGQAESVLLASNDYNRKETLIVFNIDTIRDEFELPSNEDFGDGFLEVFEGDGDGWSFVEPIPGTTNVERTAEKIRISKYCSNGLYAFRSLSDFRHAYQEQLNCEDSAKTEMYIAPMYNYLIRNGKNIKYRLVPKEKIHHCGLPEDYMQYASKMVPLCCH